MNKEDRVAAFTRELSSDGKVDDRAYYRAYFQLFNDQQYYEAHDVLEQLWLKALEPDIQSSIRASFNWRARSFIFKNNFAGRPIPRMADDYVRPGVYLSLLTKI